MSVRIEKSGSVWTVIHSRFEARNAMDPKSADDLVAAFEQFDAEPSADVAVFWGEGGAFCAGWDLKSVSSLDQANPVKALDFPGDGGKAPRGPLGPSRLELSKPVIAAVHGYAIGQAFESVRDDAAVRVIILTAAGPVFCAGMDLAELQESISGPIDPNAGVSKAFEQVGLGWADLIISAAGVAGITSVLLVMMLGQPRILLAMSRDGLLPPRVFAAVHPRFQTPWKSTILTGLVVATASSLPP